MSSVDDDPPDGADAAVPASVPLAAVRPLAVAVRCRGVVKQFGEGDTKTIALRGVDVEVFAGQLTLLVGESGCGKTTLISLIAGLLEPTAGTVEVLGRDLATLSGSQLARFRAAHIGFVFQQYNLLPTMTAAENAAIPLVINGHPRRGAVAQARELLNTVGLAGKADSLPAQLSGGQQQRVAIARALIHQPRLLVCDEPTAALDAKSGQRMMELMRAVAVQAGRAVIVVTHDARVLEFGDRRIHMEDGRVDRVE
jgi:putative ABC transport system ATP-binding protein